MVATKIFQQQKIIKHLWPEYCDKYIINKASALTSDKCLWKLRCFAFARMLDAVNGKKKLWKIMCIFIKTTVWYWAGSSSDWYVWFFFFTILLNTFLDKICHLLILKITNEIKSAEYLEKFNDGESIFIWRRQKKRRNKRYILF